MNAIDVFDLGLLRLNELFTVDFSVDALSSSEVVDNNRVDGEIEIEGVSYPYLAVTHRGIAPLRNQNAYWRKEKGGVPIFFVPMLDAKERSACRKEGIQFVDTMGNCYLDVPGCHVYVSKEVTSPKRVVPTGKAFQAGGLRFIMAVYNEPSLLNDKYTDIGSKTGISTGALSGIFEDLRASGFIRKDEETSLLSITNELELVKRFAYAYLADVRPKIRRGTFYMVAHDTLDKVRNAKPDHKFLVGGQHAANVRGNYLFSPVYNFYTDVRIATLAKEYSLIPVGNTIDRNRATVEVYNTFGGDFASGYSQGITLVNDLLIYADLLDSHDVRVHDAAQKLLTNEIFDKFRENWLRYGRTAGILSAS